MTDIESDVVIFCQAPTKVPTVLACYEENRNAGRSVAIVVFNVALVYDFVKSLGLDLVSLEYYPSPFVWTKNPFRLCASIMSIWCRARELGIRRWRNKTVYFSCICSDPQVHALLWWLRKYNRVVYMHNRVDESVIPVPYKTLGLRVKLFLLRTLLGGVHFVGYQADGIHSQGLPKDLFEQWYPSDLSGILAKYSRKVVSVRGGRCAIFFSNPFRDPYTTEDSYVACHVAVAKRLKELGYRIVGKGHPRLGALGALDGYTDEKLPDFLPAEFIDLEGVSICIGLTTTSICATAIKGVPSYSFLPLLKIVDAEFEKYWYSYVDNNSARKIRYIRDVKEWMPDV